MKPVSELTRSNLRMIKAEINEALEAVGEKYGLDIKVGGGNFTAANAKLNCMIATKGEGGAVNTREAEDFKRMAFRYGLKPEDFGRTFTEGGKVYKIVGCKPKSYQYPILCEQGGKTYKLPADRVVRGLAAMKASA